MVAILGPRQCGKSTLANYLSKKLPNFLYLDLESITDLNKLNNPEFFFLNNKDKTVCLDEIQRRPDLFPVLRSIIDRDRRPGKIIILGSASGALLKQSSESLAGRISYNTLTPFTISEIPFNEGFSIQDFGIRGGFPSSILAKNLNISFKWRNNFIKTFFEQDIPQLGIKIPSIALQRFFILCAHTTGQMANFSKMGEAFGATHHTVKRYIDLLNQTFILRTLYPYFTNIKKRLVKNPKIYIRDSGLLHTLLGLHNINDLMGHPVYGQSWEAFAIENILSELPGWNAFYFRTSNGAEIDLILEKGRKKIVVEFKVSSAPKVNSAFQKNMELLGIPEAWIIAPITEQYKINNNITVSGLEEFIAMFK